MSDSPKATVGRIVHFYDTGLADEATRQSFDFGTERQINLNCRGEGPYAALVIDTFPGSAHANLKVSAYGGDWIEGSVSEHSETNNQRYWVWPPKV